MYTIERRQHSIIPHTKTTPRQANHSRHRNLRRHVPAHLNPLKNFNNLQPSKTLGHRPHDQRAIEPPSIRIPSIVIIINAKQKEIP